METALAERMEIGGMVDLVGSRFELVARLGAGPDDTVLFRTRMAPGKLVPLHSHVDPECFYVLDGQIEILILDDAPRWHPVKTGESLLVADAVKHASRNPTDKVADMVLATNNRFAAFLSAAGRAVVPGAPFASPSPDDIQGILRVSQDYGYWNASPAESAAAIAAASGA